MYPSVERLKELLDLSDKKGKSFLHVRKSKPYGPGKVRMKEYAQDIKHITTQINRIEKQEGIPNSCKSGCNACCNHCIQIAGFDAENILNYIDHKYNADTKKRIYAKIDAAATCVDLEIGPMPTSPNDLEKIMKFEDRVKSEYFKAQIPCPLLSDEGQCMVYEVRPLPCWSYRSYGDPSDCFKSHDIPHSISHSMYETYVLNRLELSLQSGDVPTTLEYLITAPLPQKLRQWISK